jgi:Peptidase family M1 domain
VRSNSRLILLAGILAVAPIAVAQNQTPPQPTNPEPAQTAEPAPPPGKVLFSRHLSTDVTSDDDATPPANSAQPAAEPAFSSSQATTPRPTPVHQDSKASVSDGVRNALTFTAYDLDVHLTPAQSQISTHARFTVRNTSAQPLTQLAFQISSSLAWESFAATTSGQLQPVTFVQHYLDTDADHTGHASEAIITLPQPLAPGASMELTAFYSGDVTPSSERLERIGAPPEQAVSADWDQIAPELTALRGFGNVLWYPASAAPVFLGDGAKLFQAVGLTRRNQAAATIHLRLAIDYVGDAPDAAFFNGRRQSLTIVPTSQDTPIATTPGTATADFPAQLLGFRTPSLFITDRAASNAGGDSNTLITAVTDHYDALPNYAAAAAQVKPLLAEWLGSTPAATLTMIDHPGQPFEDDALVLAPVHAVAADTLAPALVHTLSHAWFRSSQVWLNEGVPQFLSLLWIESTKGRDAALQQLQQQTPALALAEPEATSDPDAIAAGQSLLLARDDIFYRTKAANVLWMLRSVVGDDALKQALQRYATNTRRNPRSDQDPHAFQQTLEQTAQKNLAWFFDDWVNRDRGLPDLSITSVNARPLQGQGGHADGNLIAVEVRNDGDAAVEVPVTVRSGKLTATERLRVLARANASTRIVFQDTPQEVIVNDGSVPETAAMRHTKTLIQTK